MRRERVEQWVRMVPLEQQEQLVYQEWMVKMVLRETEEKVEL